MMIPLRDIDIMGVIQKLRIGTGKLYLLNAPPQLTDLFEQNGLTTSLKGAKKVGQIVLFAIDKQVLEQAIPKILPLLEVDALMWVAYPKKTSRYKTDISRDNGWDVLMGAGYDPVTQIAIDGDWSALRFRKTELIGPKLRDVPMEERNTEGVDYINKTVKLPKDAEAALIQHKGLKEFFYALSFSHKKEYAVAIAEAKKEDTRLRRIEKMVQMLLGMKAEKEKKRRTNNGL